MEIILVLIAVLTFAFRPRAKAQPMYSYYAQTSKRTIKQVAYKSDRVKMLHDRAHDSYGVYSVIDGMVFWYWHKNLGTATLVYRQQCRRMYKTLKNNKVKTQTLKGGLA